MSTATKTLATARAVAQRTGPAGWVMRSVVSAHAAVILAQPVFAGVYLSGDFDALGWHATGANIVTSLGYVQLVVAVVAWVRLRRPGLFLGTLGLVAAETVQYVAGMDGALWLHLPLGVLTITGLIGQFVAVWLRPLPRTARDADDRPEATDE
ncbi:hypothetical protein AB0I55_30275 [Actinocatenispora sera]|uniref:Uncharacterized protein n=1 Tax=Actinocatenispora sera TaxID=390989 RepID=A0A810KWL1_9ACTN|nr:hypothetical protein [Actinocatenispora sera]BCJ26716.1 hypothetical protein Asera_08240 [Actinocatenispora sera]